MSSVHQRHEGSIAWLRLNRPQALNALSRQMLTELHQAVTQAQQDTRVRVVVLTGTGRAFCAGGDIVELLADMPGPGSNPKPGQPDYLDVVAETFAAVRGLTKPLITAVNGIAMGGGLELILCSDLVIAARNAMIGDGHANFCIFPGGGSAALLPRRLPLNVAKHLLFSGEALPAEAWERYGIVNQIVEPDQLEAATQRLARQLSQKSPALLARLKRVADASPDKALVDALRDELFELRAHTRSQDMLEGLQAFVQKRQPSFTGQ